MTAMGRCARAAVAAFVMSYLLHCAACAPPEAPVPGEPEPAATRKSPPGSAPTAPDFGLPPLPDDATDATMTPEDLIEHLSAGDAEMKAALEAADVRVKEGASDPDTASPADRLLAIQRRAISYRSEREEFPTAQEHVARARELEGAGFGPEALVHYRKAVTRDSSDPIAWAGLGRMLAYTGKPEEALDPYGRALALAPERPGWHKELGQAFESLGRLDEARSHYAKAVELKPDYGEAYLRLAVVEWRRGGLEWD